MPIFQLDQNALVPFKRQAIASDIYEQDMESLLWDNLEELTRDNLFRVARQATLRGEASPTSWLLIRSGVSW